MNSTTSSARWRGVPRCTATAAVSTRADSRARAHSQSCARTSGGKRARQGARARLLDRTPDRRRDTALDGAAVLRDDGQGRQVARADCGHAQRSRPTSPPMSPPSSTSRWWAMLAEANSPSTRPRSASSHPPRRPGPCPKTMSVEQALELVTRLREPLESERVPLLDALVACLPRMRRATSTSRRSTTRRWTALPCAQRTWPERARTLPSSSTSSRTLQPATVEGEVGLVRPRAS